MIACLSDWMIVFVTITSCITIIVLGGITLGTVAYIKTNKK